MITELDIEIIRKDPNNQDWYYISRSEVLSEDFIREFLREFQNKVNWWRISEKQILSKEFIIEFYDKIDFECLLLNKNISKEIKDFCRMFI